MDKKTIEDDLALIKKNLTYYFGSYNQKKNQESAWYKSEHHLTDIKFLQGIYSKFYSLVGAFNAYTTKFFALDIDDHQIQYLIEKVFNEVYHKIGEPSFIVKSPRGIHCYYLLNDFCNTDILVESLRKKVNKLYYKKHIEIKPTSEVGLRLPGHRNLLNTKTLEIVDDQEFEFDKQDNIIDDRYKFGQFLENCHHYFPQEFISFNSNEKDNSVKTVFDDCILIQKGMTNDAINYYSPQWKSRGLSVEEATNLFISKLDPTYNGPCRNYNHVYRRIKCFYKREHISTKQNSEESSKENLYKQNHSVIEDIVNSYPTIGLSEYNAEKRKKSIRKDLVTLFWIIRQNEIIKSSKRNYAKWTYLHVFYKCETNKGYLPISSKLISSKNLEWFRRIGLISRPQGKHYDVHRHSCQYYYINFNYSKEKFSLLNYFYCNKKFELSINSINPYIFYNLFSYLNDRIDSILRPKTIGPPLLV